MRFVFLCVYGIYKRVNKQLRDGQKAFVFKMHNTHIHTHTPYMDNGNS